MSSSPPRSRNSCGQSLLEFDIFGESYRFRLPEGKTSFQSWKGFATTMFVMLVLVFYGGL